MTNSNNDLAHLRDLMQIEIEAGIRYRREKAVRYLELTRRGAKVTDAWQILNTDRELAELEQAMEQAKADRLVAWLAANRVSFTKDEAGFDPERLLDAEF